MATLAIASVTGLRQVCTNPEVHLTTPEQLLHCPRKVSCAGGIAGSKWPLDARRRICLALKRKQEYALDSLDFADDDDEDGEEGEEDEGEELESMQEWMQNKPVGFGVGATYDLSLETKLLEEIERDKKAQAAAKNKRKGGSEKLAKDATKTVSEPPPGFVVKVSNLPKKRNVERDLRAALRGVQGLLHIRPILLGDDKTREPTCKGTAFLTFGREKEADNFVRVFSGQPLKFGKVEKKLSLSRANSDSTSSQDVSPPTIPGRLRVREAGLSRAPAASASASEYLKGLGSKDASSKVSEMEVVDDIGPVSETELRTLEEDIWNSLEDEDDELLDAELETYEENDEGTALLETGDVARTEKALDSSPQSGLDPSKVQEGSREAEARIQVTSVKRAAETVAVDSGGKHLRVRKSDFQVLEGEQGTGVPLQVQAMADLYDKGEVSDGEDSDDYEDFGDLEIEVETRESESTEEESKEPRTLLPREVIGNVEVDVLNSPTTTAVDDKDKKIEELEQMVQALKSELKDKTGPKTRALKKRLTEEEEREAAEARIEALEKRVFWKLKNTMNSKEKTKEKTKSKGTKVQGASEGPGKAKSSRNQNVGNLGSSVRLKKKDRTNFSSVLEKYSKQKTSH